MPEINPSIMVHRLNVSPTFPPIRQKKRVFAQERDRAIAEEVYKLEDIDFIREVYYLDWLANVVMVKKANGKWRMCIDFSDLNKACPKDGYLLSCVDFLVDSIAQHQLLSFMDAFSSCNHIKLDKPRPFLLQGNVIQPQKHGCNISEAHEQDVWASDWKKCPSLRR